MADKRVLVSRRDIFLLSLKEQYVLELKGIKGILRLKVLVMQAEPVALNGRKKFLYVKWKIF